MNFNEKTITKEIVYKGGIIDVEKQSVRLDNNSIANRDIIRHPGASVVLPIDDEWNIYFVKQYRKPIENSLIEIPAGKLDKGEDPLVCAKRELKEETGIEAKFFKHLYSLHTTPGFCDEILHFYLAKDLKFGKSNTDDDEILSVEKYSIEDSIKMILRGEITDIKTVNAIQYALLYKNHLL